MNMFISAITWMAKQLTSNALDKALDVVHKRIHSGVEKEKIKAELVKSYYANRASYMQAGGLWLMALFAVPLAVWWSAVLLYSILWCADCMYSQDWTIAALPPPMDQWSGWIIISIFGVIGVTKLVNK